QHHLLTDQPGRLNFKSFGVHIFQCFPEGNRSHIIVTGQQNRMRIRWIRPEIVTLPYGQISNRMSRSSTKLILPPWLFKSHNDLEGGFHDDRFHVCLQSIIPEEETFLINQFEGSSWHGQDDLI